MSKKKNIIRPRDRIRIINPEIIDRWGYPLTTQIVKDTLITQEHKDAIYAMLAKFRGCPQPPVALLTVPEDDYDEAYEKVLHTMAYEMVRQKGFGGRDRKLFTTMRESLRNKTAVVMERKVVKTGKYHSGGGGYSYDGDWDYEPAYLEDEKTHVLYKIYLDYGQENVCENINMTDIWIERTNVEKIIEQINE